MNDLEGLKAQMQTMRDLEDITKMLEQVAARDIARMRQDILDSRRFFREVWRVHKALKQLAPPPPQVIRKHLIVAVGIDWGMPGALLGRTLSAAEALQRESNADMVLAGRKLHSRYRSGDGHTVHRFSVPKNASLKDIQPIYKVVAGYAKVTFVYPRFDTLSKQTIVTASFDVGAGEDDLPGADKGEDALMAQRFIVDPDAQTLSNYLNEAVVGITVHHYFAESMLAYSAAQMVAMRNGNGNAQDAVKDTQTKYNRARRANIDAKIRELYRIPPEAGAR